MVSGMSRDSKYISGVVWETYINTFTNKKRCVHLTVLLVFIVGSLMDKDSIYQDDELYDELPRMDRALLLHAILCTQERRSPLTTSDANMSAPSSSSSRIEDQNFVSKQFDSNNSSKNCSCRESKSKIIFIKYHSYVAVYVRNKIHERIVVYFESL